MYGGKYFRCRLCQDLVYTCQTIQPIFWLLEKEQRIRKQLGGSADITDMFPPKPKGMHWKKYKKLKKQAELASMKYRKIALEQYVWIY